MKNLRMPISFRAVAAIREKVPVLAPVLAFLRRIFGNVYIKSLVMVGYPVSSLIVSRLIDFKKYPVFTKQFFDEIWPFTLLSIIYLGLVMCFAFVEHYSKFYLELSRHFLSMLNKIQVLSKDISTEVLNSYKNIINDINFCDNNISNLHIIMENNTIVDKVGTFFCSAIYEWLCDVSEKTCFNVSCLQMFKDDQDREYIVMTAYKNEDGSEPDTYLKPIHLNDGSEKKYYSRLLFEKNISEIQILENRKEIERYFFLGSTDDDSENKTKNYDEKKTKQYVAIPVRIKNKTMLMFQITTEEDRLLGRNEKEIKKNIKLLLPLINFIQPFYYEDHLMKDLCYHTVACFGRRKARGK